MCCLNQILTNIIIINDMGSLVHATVAIHSIDVAFLEGPPIIPVTLFVFLLGK